MVQVVPARPEWLEALVVGDDEFARRFDIPVVEGWAGFPEVVPHLVEGVRERPEDPWGTQLFFDEEDGALVGMGGFMGPPDDGTVELGYAVAPARQGRGFATAVVAVLLGRAREAGVEKVIAHTLPEANASTAVLVKNGFVRDGESHDPDEGTVWRWASFTRGDSRG